MQIIERPGYSGRRKTERTKEWNSKYGEGNWDYMWKWEELWLDFEGACRIYEDAYFQDSFNREDLWKHLFSIASEFYDNVETNVDSGYNYNIQEAYSTHIQDIAARNVGRRRGWKLEGNRLVQIRGPDSEGHQLMPGIVPFHEPERIIEPRIEIPKWAGHNSVESWYQNAKHLVLK